ncbi:MAG: SDR family oxidoreductase [Muribaculum sp.]|nr:SDR family oxidoreductase [Muribaculum sp.]
MTASSSGIGRATADAFLGEGATVVINGRDGTKLAEALLELRSKYGEARVYSFCGDMSVDATIREASQFLKKELRHMFNLNLFGAVGLIRDIGGLFPESGESVVLLSSLAAHERIGAPPAYAAAKSAVVSLVKYAAPILMKQGVRINAVSPGNVYFEGGVGRSFRHKIRLA